MPKTEYKLGQDTATILRAMQLALRVKVKDTISVFESKHPKQGNENYRMETD